MKEEYELGWEFFTQVMTVMHACLEHIEASLAELDLDPKSFFLLNVLEEHPYPAQLAKRLMLPGPTVTFLLKKLEASGHVKRSSEPNDLRKFRFTMTASGKKAMQKGQAALNEALNERLSKLTATDREKLFHLFAQLK
jgi:DNA-binding MarR family transcriptional regulator